MSSQTTQANAPRKVSLFRNGKNQALRIPRDLEFQGKEALLTRDGNRLIIEPAEEHSTLLAVLSGLQPIEEPFPDVDDGLPELDTPNL